MTVELTRTVYVRIVNDYDLVTDFLKWTTDERVYPIGGGAVGGGLYSYHHHENDRERIAVWFAMRGALASSEESERDDHEDDRSEDPQRDQLTDESSDKSEFHTELLPPTDEDQP